MLHIFTNYQMEWGIILIIQSVMQQNLPFRPPLSYWTDLFFSQKVFKPTFSICITYIMFLHFLASQFCIFIFIFTFNIQVYTYSSE